MKVSAGRRSTTDTGERQVTVQVTGIANNDYLRSADATLKIPYSRMNETMRMVQRMGGRIADVSVSGGDLCSSRSIDKPAESSDEAGTGNQRK